MFKKDGSQITFWDSSINQSTKTAMTLADLFVDGTKTEIMADSYWFCESPNFWRRKITFAASPEETSFSLHISVGAEDAAGKSST